MVIYWIFFLPFFLISSIFTLFYSEPEMDPLQTMIGRWAYIEDSCETDWVEYSLSPDRNIQLIKLADGTLDSADILEIRSNEFLIRYEDEERVDEQGDILEWWLVFTSDSEYKMRRKDWRQGSLTRETWVRCP